MANKNEDVQYLQNLGEENFKIIPKWWKVALNKEKIHGKSPHVLRKVDNSTESNSVDLGWGPGFWVTSVLPSPV